jgi:hypothetical protein
MLNRIPAILAIPEIHAIFAIQLTETKQQKSDDGIIEEESFDKA